MNTNSSTIIICVPELRANDAVGNDVFLQYKALKLKNNKVYIYAQKYEKQFNKYVISWNKFKKLLRNHLTTVIYHHCVFWELANTILSFANCKLYLRYHGLTPSIFFEKYNDIESVYATKQGEKQTLDFIKSKKFSRFLPTSNYIAKELFDKDVPQDSTYVIPPFNLLDDFKNCREDPEFKQQLSSNTKNILFVGRFAPNKGHIYLLNTIKYYTILYDTNIILHLVGSFSQNSMNYLHTLYNYIRTYDIKQNVKFYFNISFNQLHTLYNNVDVFLLLSEHEGFCVPILEAQWHGCPVLAYGSTAIKDTIGDNQLVFDNIDYCLFATALNEIFTNDKLKHLLYKNGYNNIKKYTFNVIKELLYQVI